VWQSFAPAAASTSTTNPAIANGYCAEKVIG
jgi:hypothetical protein